MSLYEYKVVPAPAKGRKAKGVKTPEGRFALSVETVLNEMAAEGWEYLRAELLPSDERSGLTGSSVNWRNVLVFRRSTVADMAALQPQEIDLPAPIAATPAQPDLAPVHEEPDVAAPAPIAQPAEDEPKFAGAARMLKDNGVEEVSEVAGMTSALRARAAQAEDESNTAENGDETDESDKTA